MECVDRLPLSAVATTLAGALSNAAYNTLLPQTVGPFHVIFVQLRTLTISEMVINNIILIERARRVAQLPLGVVASNQLVECKNVKIRWSTVAHNDPTTRSEEVPEQPQPDYSLTQRGSKTTSNHRAEGISSKWRTSQTIHNDPITRSGKLPNQSELHRLLTWRGNDQTRDARSYTPDGTDQEHNVDRVTRHVGTANSICRIIRWYGFSAKEHTKEQLENKLAHFISRHRQWTRAKSKKEEMKFYFKN